MNKITLAFTALGLIAATHANAVSAANSYDYEYHDTAPSKASYTMTLSGECSGKITQTVDYVSIGYQYQTDSSGQIVRDGSYQNVYIESPSFGSDNFYAEHYGYNFVTGDKFSEAVAKGKRTASFTLVEKDNSYPRVWPISDEAQFSSQIKCKGGKTLGEVLNGWSLYINEDDASYKAKASVKLVSSLDNPTTAQYTIKQVFSGIAEQASLCTVKGTVGTESSNVKCAQPKPIKISVQVNAQGTALAP